MEDSGKEIENSTSKFRSILVYIVGIIVNAYWGHQAYWGFELFGVPLIDDDFFAPISVSLIFSFLALSNYRKLKRLKFTIFVISASILLYVLSFIIYFFSTPWGG